MLEHLPIPKTSTTTLYYKLITMTKLQNKFLKETQKKTYEQWYIKWYYILNVIGFALLALSALASWKYYEGLIDFGYASTLSLIPTITVSVLVGWLTVHVFDYWHQNFNTDLFVYILVGLFIWNGYTDFVGSPEIAETLMQAPTDLKSESILNNIAAIEKQEKALLSTYSWKGVTPAKIPLRSKWHDVKSDKATMKQYHDRKAVLNESLSNHTKQFANDSDKFNTKLERSKSTLKGLSLLCTLLFILIQAWCFSFKYRVVDSITQSDTNTTQRDETPTSQAEQAFNELVETNQALQEELQARRENENKTRNDFF